MQKEYFKKQIEEFVVQIMGSKIEAIRNKKSIAKSVRIFNKGYVGIAATKSDMDFQTLEKRAKESLKSGIFLDYELPKDNKKTFKTIKKHFKKEDIIDTGKKVLKLLNSNFNQFLFSGQIRYYESIRELKNTNGIDYKVEKNRLSTEIVFKHKDSANIIDGFWGNDYNEEIDIDDFIERLKPYLNNFNNNISINDNKLPILFPYYTSTMPFAFIRKHINGELYENGASYFNNKLNKKIFNKDFSLYDINLLPKEGIVSPFDGDGYMRDNKILPIFENGVLKNVLYDLRRAKKFNRKPTGTSSRSYNSNTSISTNMLILPDSDIDIKSFKRAIVLMISSGGDFQDNGNISLPVQLAYLIENGNIIGRLDNFILTNNIKYLFNEDYIGALKNGLFENRLLKFVAFNMNINKG